MSCQLNADTLSIGGQTRANSSAMTFPTAQLKSYTVTATSGTGLGGFSSVTGSYLDMGAIKMAWASGTATWNSSTVASSGTLSFSLPSSLFATVQNVQLTVRSFDPTLTQSIVLRGATTSSISFILFNSTGANMTTGSGATVYMFVLGI